VKNGCAIEFLTRRRGRASAPQAPQRAALVQGDVVGLVAFDLVLRLVPARVVDVALDLDVPRVHAQDMAAHAAGLGIPAHVVADPKGLSGRLRHGTSMRGDAGLFQPAFRSFNQIGD
jgi:hypothetical protein